MHKVAFGHIGSKKMPRTAENAAGGLTIIACGRQEYACIGTIGKENVSNDQPDFEHGESFDLAVEEARPKLKEPPLYRVVLINDDYTPMEFVVHVLESIFSMERTRATQVMLEVHTKGKGVCGVYNYEIAETKVAQVMGVAQQHQHPLLCTLEES